MWAEGAAMLVMNLATLAIDYDMGMGRVCVVGQGMVVIRGWEND
jgi:hypothetical protein